MNPFELTASLDRRPVERPTRLDDFLRDTFAAPPVRDKVVTDASGKFEVRLNPGGTAIYCKDGQAEWESKDGKHWTRKGSSGTDFFDGRVSVDDGKTITITNSDTGVTVERKHDGTTTRSITTRHGAKYSVTADSTGKQLSCETADSDWITTDGGKSWTEKGGKQKWQGSLAIDDFGRYMEKPAGGKDVVKASSRELTESLNRQDKIMKDWGIKIAPPGEQITYSGTTYTCKSPTKLELDQLEKTLYRNQQMEVKDLRFSFVKAGTLTDKGGLWGVYQRTGNGGKPQILIMPQHTEAKGWTALEGTLEHEIEHHEQYNQWGSSEWGGLTAPAYTKELNKTLGWRYDRASGSSLILDRVGNEWKNTSAGWAPFKDGRADTNKAISNTQMRDQAKVRPSTNYFTYPSEMHAEGMAMFRMERAMLLKESPAMYEIAKQLDQDLIDKKWGKQPDGKPKFIRSADGGIVEGNKENLEAVRKAEDRWRRDLEPKPLKLGDRIFACACCNKQPMLDDAAPTFRR